MEFEYHVQLAPHLAPFAAIALVNPDVATS